MTNQSDNDRSGGRFWSLFGAGSRSVATTTNLLLLLLAMGLGRMLRNNPLWLGWKVDPKHLPSASAFPIVTSHPVLDSVLEWHRSHMFADDREYVTIRNHGLRLLTFAQHYWKQEKRRQHNMMRLQKDKEEDSPIRRTAQSKQQQQDAKLSEQELNVLALGAAYHLVGFWVVIESDAPLDATHLHTYASAWMERELQMVQELLDHGELFSKHDLRTARAMLFHQFKYTAWNQNSTTTTTTSSATAKQGADDVVHDRNHGAPDKQSLLAKQRGAAAAAAADGEQQDTTQPAEEASSIIIIDEALVNAMRRAIWTDLSYGLFKTGLPASYLEAAFTTHEDPGLHTLLLEKTQSMLQTRHTWWTLWQWTHLFQY